MAVGVLILLAVLLFVLLVFWFAWKRERRRRTRYLTDTQMESLLAEASDTSTSPERLSQIAQIDTSHSLVSHLRCWVAANPNADADTLRALCRFVDQQAVQEQAGELYWADAETGSMINLLARLAANSNTPSDVVDAIVSLRIPVIDQYQFVFADERGRQSAFERLLAEGFENPKTARFIMVRCLSSVHGDYETLPPNAQELGVQAARRILTLSQADDRKLCDQFWRSRGEYPARTREYLIKSVVDCEGAPTELRVDAIKKLSVSSEPKIIETLCNHPLTPGALHPVLLTRLTQLQTAARMEAAADKSASAADAAAMAAREMAEQAAQKSGVTRTMGVSYDMPTPWG